MEDRKNYPPPPSNYVSLLQLQERWLQEKQKKQREKEGEEERRGDERENQRLKKGDDGTSTETRSRYVSRRPIRRNDRMVPREDRRALEGRVQKSKEKEVEEAVAVIERESIDESEKSKDKRKKKGKKKQRPSAEDKAIEGTAQLVPENETKQRIPAIVTEKKDEMKAPRKKFPQRSEKLGADDKVLGEKVPVDRMGEIRRKFQSLSMNRGYDRGNYRSGRDRNGDRRSYRSYETDHRWEVQRPRNNGLVWVRKGESSSDGNVAVGQDLGS